VGNEAWQARSTDDPNAHSGLAEILEEISPIEDFSGTMSLSFSSPRFDEVKASIEECKEKDLTYCAPLFVTAEFTNNTTGEIKSQTVFMGDFPMMTPKGTFVINGTERVVVSQLVRSPGVYFTKEPDKTSDRDLSSVKVIPSRGAWLEFDIDKRDTVGVRIDRKRRQAVTVLLKAIGWSADQIRERFGWSELLMTTLEKDHIAGQDEALLDIYRKLRPGEPPTRENAQTLLDNLFFNPKRYDVAKVGRYKFNKKLEIDVPITRGVLTERTSSRPSSTSAGCTPVRRATRPTTSTTSATVACAPSASSSRTRSVSACPDGARRPRAHDDPGRRGDHAADPDQHPPGGGGDQGVLRHLAAVAVHGPDQPAGGPDPPAPAERARPGWSVA
jgi:DNA-directed RNA polymerase beta subunit